MSKHFITIGDLFSKFPYLKTNKIDLKEYAEGIENFMGKEYYKAFNNYQMRFTYKKRQALLKEYYRNYMTYFDDTETEPLYDSFKFFLEIFLEVFISIATFFYYEVHLASLTATPEI